jgi:5-(carboxyamino)imidazole ribonucleotide mutase
MAAAAGSAAGAGGAPEGAPVVAVVMGSASDLTVMQGAADVLAEFGLPHEVRVVSAHRTPDDMLAFGHGAAGSGLKVVIAGAGGAAHLPGMLAAVTPLPVIGVPVALSQLDGLDSLLSMVQMPRGVPVATVAVNGARNAGLLAVRILAVDDDTLTAAMVEFQAGLADTARAQDADVAMSRRGDEGNEGNEGKAGTRRT